MQFASLRMVAQGTQYTVSRLVIKKPGDLPLAACPPLRSPQQQPSKCADQGRTAGHTRDPSQVSSCQAVEQAPGCLQPKERGGWHVVGSSSEQTAPARLRALLVVIAPKAVIISSFLSGSSANGPWPKSPPQRGTLLYLGYTQRFSAVFCSYRNLSVSLRFSVEGKQTPTSPLASQHVHCHVRRPKQRLGRIALSQALGEWV